MIQKRLLSAVIHSFVGALQHQWMVEQSVLDSGNTKAAPAPSHHILCVDRSGSMYGDIDDVKSTLTKLLTLEEARDSKLIVSVISYSSQRDTIVHASRVPIAEFMAAKSPHLAAVQKIQATGLTCISQSLDTAKTLIRSGETTCVTLHSDGYANDPSPGSEGRALREKVMELRTLPGVFVNTVAYRAYSDFQTLSALAALGGGQCFAAPTAAELSKALGQTQHALAGSLTPTIEIGAASKQRALVVLSDGRVLFGKEGETLRIDGLPAGASGTVYRFNEMQTSGMGAMPPNEAGPNFYVALARGALAQGSIELAKYAMMSSGLSSLRDPLLLRALSGPDLAMLSTFLETVDVNGPRVPANEATKIKADGPSLLQFATFVRKHKDDLALDGPDLLANYKRIGVKSLDGSRDKKTGAITPPRASVKDRDASPWWPVGAMESNTASANMNLRVDRPVDLVVNGQVQSEIAGVKLTNLTSYRNYTLVVDGQTSVPSIRMRASTEKARKALSKFGSVDAEGVATVPIGTMPVLAYDTQVPVISRKVIDTYFVATALSKIVAALQKGAPKAGTGTYSPDQLAALRDVYITPSLNFSPPSTVPYTDRKAALAAGSIDTRISYCVDVGTTLIQSAGSFPSANAYLERRFTLTVNGKDQEIDWPSVTQMGAKVDVKNLTARTKLSAVDDLLFPLYSQILGLQVTRDDPMAQFFANASTPITQQKLLQKLVTVGEAPDAAKLGKMADYLDGVIDDIREEYLKPFALYTGASGILPAGYATKLETADQITKRYPNLKINSEQADGSFFEQPDHVLLSVYPTESDFSTTKPA